MFIADVSQALWNSELGDDLMIFFGVISFAIACIWVHRRAKQGCLVGSPVAPPPFAAPPELCLAFGVSTLMALFISQLYGSPIFALIFYFEIIFGMTMMVFSLRGVSPFGWQRLNPLAILAIGLIGASAIYTATSVIGVGQQCLADYFHITLAEQEAVQELEKVPKDQLPGVVATAVLFAPFCEELFFRGFLFTALKKYFSPWPAIILSGFTFGLIHWNLNAFLPLSCMGIALALVYETTGSLIAPFAIHCLFNLFSCLLILYQVQHPE